MPCRLGAPPNTSASEVPEWPAELPCAPQFMLIGTPKSGSTSLFHYLAAHPEVLAPAHKELCYFSAFKRHMKRRCLSTATSWPLYTAAFAGAAALRDRTSQLARSSAWPAGAGRRRRAHRGGPGSDGARDDHGRCMHKLPFEGCPFYLGEVRAPRVARRPACPHTGCATASLFRSRRWGRRPGFTRSFPPSARSRCCATRASGR